jgi:hypothetical protein
VFLLRSQRMFREAGAQRRTAIPAKAPASIFADSEKFGGNDS